MWEPEGGGVGRGATKWRLAKTASPGNLGAVEDLLFAHTDLLAAPVIVAVRVQVKDSVKTVGVAYADSSAREMGVAQFVDTDLFSNTEVRRCAHSLVGRARPIPTVTLAWLSKLFCSAHTTSRPQALLIQLGAKEALVVEQDKALEYDLAKLNTLLERCGIVITPRKKSELESRGPAWAVPRAAGPASRERSLVWRAWVDDGQCADERSRWLQASSPRATSSRT